MIHEFDLVTLNRAIPEYSLPAGVGGTVVDTARRADGFVTVEFFDDMNETIEVLPISISDLSPVEGENPQATPPDMTGITGRFVYNEGVIYVPAWEWNTTQDSLLGSHMRTNVYPIMELRKRGLDRLPTPAFALTFDNGWTVVVAMRNIRRMKGRSVAADAAEVFVAQQEDWNNDPHLQSQGDLRDTEVLALIRYLEAQPQRTRERTLRSQ